jgi:Xaa-Pro aminopeptidase
MPHYRASRDSHAVIEGDGLLLVDSGGQYLGGTTDVTRVWKIGNPSAAQRRDFTLVLKGTMALSRARFPRGTLSPMLGLAGARAALGRGHRVSATAPATAWGYFLNVHEGPQTISKAIGEPQMAMEPGMITSVEQPSVYREGQVGRAHREPGAERAGRDGRRRASASSSSSRR